MTIRHTTSLPTGVIKRGLTRAEAAAYLGLGTTEFNRWVTQGLVPPPLRRADRAPPRWDRLALDAYLDRLSGLSAREAPGGGAEWLARIKEG